MREFQRSHNGRGIIRVLPPQAPQPSDEGEKMPRIPDGFLDCVVYLYPSEDDANEGSGIGGSGFLAGVISDDVPQPFWFLYVVTAKHVVSHGSLFVRMTTTDGKKHVHETKDGDWVCHPDGDDVAVSVISFDPKKFRFSFIPVNDFLREEQIAKSDIGIGDEAFVLGRFINHEGKQRNSPTARTGIISQMPIEPIHMREIDQECFLVEARSFGGYSGSPVFWRVLPFSGMRKIPNWRHGQIGPLLLGIEVGYIYDWSEVCDSAGRPIMHGGSVAQKVQINTGMMIVIPAWRLVKLLLEGAPMAHRQSVEKQIREHTKKTRGGVALSSKTDETSVSADDANPNHLADFTRLVDVAARKRPQGDQT
jgi:hypothetical protein